MCAVLLERHYQGNIKPLAVGNERLHCSLLVDWLLNVPNILNKRQTNIFFVRFALVKGQEVMVAVDINYHWNNQPGLIKIRTSVHFLARPFLCILLHISPQFQ